MTCDNRHAPHPGVQCCSMLRFRRVEWSVRLCLTHVRLVVALAGRMRCVRPPRSIASDRPMGLLLLADVPVSAAPGSSSSGLRPRLVAQSARSRAHFAGAASRPGGDLGAAGRWTAPMPAVYGVPHARLATCSPISRARLRWSGRRRPGVAAALFPRLRLLVDRGLGALTGGEVASQCIEPHRSPADGYGRGARTAGSSSAVPCAHRCCRRSHPASASRCRVDPFPQAPSTLGPASPLHAPVALTVMLGASSRPAVPATPSAVAHTQ